MKPNQSMMVWGPDGEVYSIHRNGHGGWYTAAHLDPLPLFGEQKLLVDLIAAAQARLVWIDNELEHTKLAEMTEGRLMWADGRIFPTASMRINLLPRGKRRSLPPPPNWEV